MIGSSGRFALPPIAVLAGWDAVAVLVDVAHVRWGFIWFGGCW